MLNAAIGSRRPCATKTRPCRGGEPLGWSAEAGERLAGIDQSGTRVRTPADGEEALKEEFYANVGKGTKDGPPVDSVGVLPDGTRLEGGGCVE